MNTDQETGKSKWSRDRGYTLISDEESKGPVMKSFTPIQRKSWSIMILP